MSQKNFPAASRGIYRRALLLAAGLVAGAQATTYTITSNSMALTNDGTCGFREALDAINTGFAKWGCPTPSGGAGDVINLSANTYTTPVPLTLLLPVSIRCPSGTCIIDAGSINGNLFTVSGGYTPDVAMYRLTLRQSSSNTNFISGVALYQGNATLDQTVITGFRNSGFYATSGSTLNFQKCSLSGNNTGIELDNSGVATLHGNTISNNAVGMYVENGSLANSDSGTYTGNGSGIRCESGAIYNENASLVSNSSGVGINIGNASVTLYAVTVSGNRDRGIFMEARSNTVTMYFCNIDGNSTSGDGAGLCALSDGGGGTSFGNIYSTTFSNNKAAGNGGGVFISGTINLKACTISSNTAARGGGVYDYVASTNSYLDIIQSTVAFNTATVSGGGVVNVRGNGADDVGLHQSIVAKNTAPTYPDLSGLSQGGSSIIGDLRGSLSNRTGDFPSADPLLGPLMDSPGRLKVKTHALLKGSPAINMVSAKELSFTVDGRGFPRPASSSPEKWDVGAYEVTPFETESLTVISQSSDDHRIQNESGLSNGAGTVLRADAVGDYVTYAVTIPEPGTYDIYLRIKAGPNRPIVEMATAPGTSTFTTIGSADLYRSSLTYLTRTVGSFPFTSAGIKYFRLKVTGKNVNSTGYLCYFDHINIVKE